MLFSGSNSPVIFYDLKRKTAILCFIVRSSWSDLTDYFIVFPIHSLNIYNHKSKGPVSIFSITYLSIVVVIFNIKSTDFRNKRNYSVLEQRWVCLQSSVAKNPLCSMRYFFWRKSCMILCYCLNECLHLKLTDDR